MTTEQVFYLMGLISGGGAMWAGMVLFQWFVDRRVHRVEMDDYTARLRALDNRSVVMGGPLSNAIERDMHKEIERREDEYLMAQLRKANREGLL